MQIINAREYMEKREASYTVGGNVNWYSHCGGQYGPSLKIKKNRAINPIPGHIATENHNPKRYMNHNVH